MNTAKAMSYLADPRIRTGIPVTCSCRWALWFVAPIDLGMRCWGCGDRLQAIGAGTTTNLELEHKESA